MEDDEFSLYEDYYNKYVEDLDRWLPEGMVEVNLPLLKNLGLLNIHNHKEKGKDAFTRIFHVVETLEKITLINEQFVIWIIPKNEKGHYSTWGLIAIRHESYPALEVGFIASGIYNSSWLVLKILEKLLLEIQENEDLIHHYEP